MEGRAPEDVSRRELADAARRHLALAARFLGERSACIEFRKQFCSYTKGAEGGAELRGAGVRACLVEEFEALFLRWQEER